MDSKRFLDVGYFQFDSQTSGKKFVDFSSIYIYYPYLHKETEFRHDGVKTMRRISTFVEKSKKVIYAYYPNIRPTR